MSFAHHNRGRPLFSQTDIVSARERALLAENRQLRERNTRLKNAMLTLVERVETQLPYLKENTSTFERSKSAKSHQEKTTEQAFRERYQRYRSSSPKMEVYETFEEPIEFGEPAPEMRFGAKTSHRQKRPEPASSQKNTDPSSEYFISPELAPEEIDILKSPTRDRPRAKPVKRETVDVVDLHPAKENEAEAAEWYEAGAASQSDIPAFEFPEEEDVIDIDFERRETLRAAMRRRVNRLRW